MDEDQDKELMLEKEDEKEIKIEEEKKESKENKEEAKTTSAADVEAYKKAIADAEIERIRKEEKGKLYASFEKYKEDAKKSEDARKEAEIKLKEYETSKLSTEEQAALKLQNLEEANTKLQTQMQELVETANERISALQLELYKKEILAQYGDEIIPAMVNGTTIEEIIESAENAHREYISISAKAETKFKEAAADKTKLPVGTGIKPQNDRLNVGTTVADIQNIKDPKVWEANRDKFLEEALKQH